MALQGAMNHVADLKILLQYDVWMMFHDSRRQDPVNFLDFDLLENQFISYA